jgi:hypothetical protein
MVDVVLNTDDLTIFAPPENIEVQVDIGPQGVRGSKFFVGAGNPNSGTITVDGKIAGQQILLGDIYINVSPGEGYGFLYQYVAEPGGNVWVAILDINPTIYSINYSAIFEDGTAQIVIPINDIITVSTEPLTVENFNVKYDIEHTNPIASAMQVSATSSDLVIDINAVEYDSSSWVALGDTGTYTSGLELTTNIQVTIISSVI